MQETAGKTHQGLVLHAHSKGHKQLPFIASVPWGRYVLAVLNQDCCSVIASVHFLLHFELCCDINPELAAEALHRDGCLAVLEGSYFV